VLLPASASSEERARRLRAAGRVPDRQQPQAGIYLAAVTAVVLGIGVIPFEKRDMQ